MHGGVSGLLQEFLRLSVFEYMAASQSLTPLFALLSDGAAKEFCARLLSGNAAMHCVSCHDFVLSK